MIAHARVSAMLMLATLATAFVLAIMPVPGLVGAARPAIYTLTVLFWIAYQPARFGLIAAWVAGTLMDIVYGTPFAEYGLAMAVAAYVLIKTRHWLWDMPRLQQMILIAPAMAAYEFMLFWIDGVAGLDVAPIWRWLPVISSTLVWPLWAYVLERITEFEVE